MAKNENLHAAKANANDEFYTQYSDIANELGHYRQHLRGAIVYCNCDDPIESEFYRFFHNNFASLGLKKLICTHYRKDAEPSYAVIYEGGDDFNMNAGKIVTIYGNEVVVKDKKIFYTAGDFRSEACIEFLKEADIVCTNPPFSLWRQYLAQLIDYGKRFVIIGSKNSITYKEVFPLIKENKMWIGYGFTAGNAYFAVPTDADVSQYAKGVYDPETKKVHFRNVTWFTNLDIKKRHDGIWHINGKFDHTQAHKYYEGNEDKYPKYDNYDAIEVSKTKDIPIDYAGVMGVPITWLDKWNPDEFEIIGLGNGAELFGPTKTYVNAIMHKNGKTSNGNAINRVLVYPYTGTEKVYYTADNSDIKLFAPYARILIRNRNPISKKDDLGY